MTARLRLLLWCVDPVHALAGSLLVACALLLGLLWLAARVPPRAVEAGILLVGPFCALLSAARLRWPTGTARRRAAYEVLMAAALGALLAGGTPLALAALGLLPALARASLGGLPGAALALAAGGPAFLVLRAGLRLWLSGKRLWQRGEPPGGLPRP